MRKSSLSLATLTTLTTLTTLATMAPMAGRRRASSVPPQGNAVLRIQPRFTGRRYPEQSTRQALRLHRRAQGGLGLVFTGTGYEPKLSFDDYVS